jgi:hypothetical protein
MLTKGEYASQFVSAWRKQVTLTEGGRSKNVAHSHVVSPYILIIMDVYV